MFTGLFRRPHANCPHSPWLACARKPRKTRFTTFANCAQGPTPGRWPENINTPRLTATTEHTLSDRTSRPDAATNGTNLARSPANNAAEVRSDRTKSSHPQPHKQVADHHTEKS